MDKKYLHTALIYSLLLVVFGGSLFYYSQWEGILNSLTDQKARSQIFNTINGYIYYPLHGSMILLLVYSVYNFYVWCNHELYDQKNSNINANIQAIEGVSWVFTGMVLVSYLGHLCRSWNLSVDIRNSQGVWIIVYIIQILSNLIMYYRAKLAKMLDQHMQFYWGVSIIVYFLGGLLIWNMEWIYRDILIRIVYVVLICVTVSKILTMFLSQSIVDSINLENKRLSSILYLVYSISIYLFAMICSCFSLSVDLMKGYERIYWVLVILTSIIALCSLICFFTGDFPEKEKRKRFDEDVLDSGFYKNDN